MKRPSACNLPEREGPASTEFSAWLLATGIAAKIATDGGSRPAATAAGAGAAIGRQQSIGADMPRVGAPHGVLPPAFAIMGQ